MADILRVTQPLVNKAQVVDPKKNVESVAPFNLQDVSKVTKPASQSELLMQNNGLNEQRTSELLMNLLKDPSVTVSFLKSIAILRDIVQQLIPANNNTLTKEIEQMFDAIMLSPEELTREMVGQERAATRFNGELFDMLRNILGGKPQGFTQMGNMSDVSKAVADLLKVLNKYAARHDMLDAVANNLEFISQSLAPSKALSEKILLLSGKFRLPGAAENFESLKSEVMALVPEVHDSILLSDSIGKILSIAIYNLSRFSGDTQPINENLEKLLVQLSDEQLSALLRESIAEFLQQLESDSKNAKKETAENSQRVLDILAQIIDKQSSSKELMNTNGDRLGRVIGSLLSSPSNFTPLLHFVLPVQYQNIQSFMEMWINPDGEQDRDNPQEMQQDGQNIHMLMVFDIENLGRFEMEMFVKGKNIEMSLLCPAAYTPVFKETKSAIINCVSALDYRMKDVKIEDLGKPRSLMDVFKMLPYRRTGIDVKA